MSENLVLISGSLPRDPEVKESKAGKPWCSFSICQGEGQGEGKSFSYFDVKSFSETVCSAVGMLSKGDRVCVKGKLSQDKWEDKNTGEKRSKIVIIAWEIVTSDPRKPRRDDDQDDRPAPRRAPSPPPQRQEQRRRDGAPTSVENDRSLSGADESQQTDDLPF